VQPVIHTFVCDESACLSIYFWPDYFFH